MPPPPSRVQLFLVVAWARGLFLTPWVVLLLITVGNYRPRTWEDKGKLSPCPTGWLSGEDS